MNDEWKKIIGTVAPALATALGGPLAGTAVGIISEKLLGKSNGTQEEIAQFVQSGLSPESLATLKKIDYDFAVQMKDLDIELEKIDSADRDSARKREITTGDYTPKVLAGLVVLGWMAVQYHIFTTIIPNDQKDVVMYMLATLNMALGMVLNYYFGSSSGSKQKTDAMSSAIKTR